MRRNKVSWQVPQRRDEVGRERSLGCRHRPGGGARSLSPVNEKFKIVIGVLLCVLLCVR